MVPVAAWIIWDRYETRALARDVAALAARGEPTTVDAIPRGGETRDRYHAARVYAVAAEHVTALPADTTFRLPRLDVDSIAAPPDLDELERTYPPHAPALQLLDQAAALDFNGFGDLTSDVPSGALVNLASLAALRADVFSARGKGDAAAASLAAAAGVWRTVRDPPFARMQVSTRMLASVRILLRHHAATSTALATLQHALAALPDRDDLLSDVRLRRARFLDDIAAPRRTLMDAAVRLAMRPWIARSNRQRLAEFDKAQRLAAAAWPEKFVASAALVQGYAPGFRRSGSGIIARQTAAPGIAFAGFGSTQAGLELAARRVAIAALAVERFRLDRGMTPASLDVLVPAYLPSVPVDPFSGRAIVYASSATEYRLYSVDQDLKDDGGALYGLGSKTRRQPQPPPGQPRDLGIRVELAPR